MAIETKVRDAIRAGVLDELKALFPEAIEICEGLVIKRGGEHVVVKPIVKKAETFDLDDAIVEFEDKQKAKAERLAAQEAKAAERAAKEVEKARLKAEKEAQKAAKAAKTE